MIGHRIRSLRRQKALSIEDLAELAKIGADTLSDLELGKRKPQARTIRNIAHALDVPLEKLTFEGVSLPSQTPAPFSDLETANAYPIEEKNIIWCRDMETACYMCWKLLFESLSKTPQPVVILPTGRTASELTQSFPHYKSQFPHEILSATKFFIDTETFGVSKEHPASRHRFVLNALKHLAPELSSSHIHFFNGAFSDGSDLEKYDALLRDFPPTTHILTFSPEGEVIGYEPDGNDDPEIIRFQRCCIRHLSNRAKVYIEPNQPSLAIISIGMQNVLSAKQLLLLILHQEKAQALKRFLTEPFDVGFPVNLLRMHPNIKVISTITVAEKIGHPYSHIVENFKNNASGD